MFTSIRVETGFASKLPALKDREFTFKPGLNVLFGQNGSGKSVLLSLLASYSGIPQDDVLPSFGWSAPLVRTDYGVPYSPKAARKYVSLGKCEAACGWDGGSVYYPKLEKADKGFFDYANGVDAQIGEMHGHYSSGTVTLARLSRSFETFEKGAPAGAYVWNTGGEGPQRERVAKHTQEAFDVWEAELPTPRGTTRTLILDEPDRALSYDAQSKLWRALPRLVERFNAQILVASHSPWAMVAPGVNLIEMDKGYLFESTIALRHLAKGIGELSHDEHRFQDWLASDYAARAAGMKPKP